MSLTTVIDDTAASIRGLPWNAVINNLASAAPDILLAVYAFSYLASVYCLVTAFRRAAEQAKGASQGNSSMAWMWNLVFSALFMALPTVIASVSISIFGQDQWGGVDNPFSYMGTIKNKTSPLGALLPLLQIIGVITFIRGLFVIRAVSIYGSNGRGNASAGKGTAFLIAGVLLVNMKALLGFISWATGMQIGAGLF